MRWVGGLQVSLIDRRNKSQRLVLPGLTLQVIFRISSTSESGALVGGAPPGRRTTPPVEKSWRAPPPLDSRGRARFLD